MYQFAYVPRSCNYYANS